MPRPVALTRPAHRLAATALTVALAATGGALVATAGDASDAATATAAAPTKARKKAKKVNVVTPGDFTGYGFDQCLAPTQKKMNRWLQHSPFLAVGIYISGDSRACRHQPNLTPRWISKQLAKGWRLLPITLGPQASCQPRFPRYDDDVTINPKRNSNKRYAAALRQGLAEASKAVEAATALGIAPGSTLWYDLEGFDLDNDKCRESALSFLSGWTQQIRALGYVSGVYSSAGSGIKALDNARVNRPNAFALPDQIWVARWDGKANTSVHPMYMRADGWSSARVKQYQGGHDETWGGVTINIDRNFLDVGRGSVPVPETHCPETDGGVKVAASSYVSLRPRSSGKVSSPGQVKALQCLLQEQGIYNGKVHGRYNKRTTKAVNAWQSTHALPVRPGWNRRAWVTLLSAGATPVVKFGSAGVEVRRLQRALKATRKTDERQALRASGVFDRRTDAALRAWQKRAKVDVTGVAGRQTWAALQRGQR